MKDLKNYLLIIAVILIAMLLYCQDKTQNSLNEQLNLQDAMNDTISLYKDKDGVSHAKITVLQTGKTKDFLKLQTNDKEIKELQELVKKNKRLLANSGSSATVLHSNTNANVSTTIVTTSGDTCNPTYIGRVYKSRDGVDWVSGRISANKDSINLDSLIVLNTFNIVIGNERKSIFHKSKPFVDVTTLNPFTTITTLRTYQTKKDKKHWVLSVGGGYGLTMYGLQPMIGINIGYKLIEF